MKKIIALLLCALLLSSCTGKETKENLPDTIDGYWLEQTLSHALHIQKNDAGETTFTYFTVGQDEGNGFVATDIKKVNDNTYEFILNGEKIKCDLSKLDENLLLNDDVYKSHCKTIEELAEKHTATIIWEFMDTFNGYWNCQDNNEFIWIGYDDEDFIRVNLGLWDAGGFPAAYVNNIVKNNDGTYDVTLYYEGYEGDEMTEAYDESYSNITIDTSKYWSDNIIIVDGIEYAFAGTDSEAAHQEFENRMFGNN